MNLLKVLGGLILASLGFAGMAVAILRYVFGQTQETMRFPLDLAVNYNYPIMLGTVSLIAFVGGIYLILRYGR